MGDMKVEDKPFFDLSKLPKENILDLYDKTVVTKINERLVMLQVREDKIIISPVGDDHRLNVEHVLDGRTLKITSELIPEITMSPERMQVPVQSEDIFYHALRDKTYLFVDGVMTFLHDGKPDRF